MKENKIKWVMLAIITGIFMAGIDGTIVATAFQTISNDFNNPSNIYWITIAYITANVAVAPIVGKLSDMYGRKRFFVLGIILFLIGSLLCGISTSINQLIIFRIIQGLGAGALFPVAFTIIYDIYPPEKRGKITGIISAIFGISSIAGPIIGGLILETLPWQGIFFVNIPIGIISLIAIFYGYHESKERTKEKID